MTSQPFAVIFDMDGVLIDTVQLNWQAHNEFLARYDVHISGDQLADYVGRALDDQVAMINQRYDLAIKTAEFEAAIASVEDRLHTHVKPKPGVIQLIQELNRLEVPIAVGTSTPRAAALKRLKTAGLLHYFDIIVTRDEVENHKPDPSVYLYAAKQLKQQPKTCVVIEDAPSGLAAAHNAAMKCCVVEVPYVPVQAVYEADLVVTSLEEVTPQGLERLL